MKFPYAKEILATLVLGILLSGCAAGMVATTQRIPTSLRAMQFNSLASEYMHRPTFVSIEKMRDGQKVLSVRIDAYGSAYHQVMFYERDVPRYIAAIDKYLEWEKMALEKGDILEKEIATIPAPSGLNIYFVFHSGNHTNHYLGVGHSDKGLLGKTSAVSFVLTRENALVLKRHLADLPNMSAEVQADAYR